MMRDGEKTSFRFFNTFLFIMKIKITYHFIQGVIIILFLSFLPDIAFSQEENSLDVSYRKFKDVFDREFDDENRGEIIQDWKFAYKKIKVPQWVLNLPESNDSVIYCIGVSDPGMEKDSAFNLAVFRAKALIALMSSAQITGITDFFESVKKSKNKHSLYREYYNITTEEYCDSSDFRIIRDTLLSDNEAVVLLSWNKPQERQSKRHSSIKAEVDVYGKYTGSDNYINTKLSRLDAVFSLKNNLKKDTGTYKYLVRNYNKGISIVSGFREKGIMLEGVSLKYFSDSAKDETEETVFSPVTLKNGLWYGLFLSVVRSIVLKSQSESVNLKSVSDKVEEGSKELVRVLSTNRVSVVINDLRIENNRLIIDF